MNALLAAAPLASGGGDLCPLFLVALFAFGVVAKWLGGGQAPEPPPGPGGTLLGGVARGLAAGAARSFLGEWLGHHRRPND